MPRFLVLFALATSVSLSLATPATRETSLVARGRPIHDLLALEPPPYQKYVRTFLISYQLDYPSRCIMFSGSTLRFKKQSTITLQS